MLSELTYEVIWRLHWPRTFWRHGLHRSGEQVRKVSKRGSNRNQLKIKCVCLASIHHYKFLLLHASTIGPLPSCITTGFWKPSKHSTEWGRRIQHWKRGETKQQPGIQQQTIGYESLKAKFLCPS